MPKELLRMDARLDVPVEVALCPYCDACLTITFEDWEQNADGTWQAIKPIPQCPNDPDVCDGEEDSDWDESHGNMPYVHWLPVEEKILAWVNSNYYFDCDNEGATPHEP